MVNFGVGFWDAFRKQVSLKLDLEGLEFSRNMGVERYQEEGTAYAEAKEVGF